MWNYELVALWAMKNYSIKNYVSIKSNVMKPINLHYGLRQIN
jgi:hypothetical protein